VLLRAWAVVVNFVSPPIKNGMKLRIRGVAQINRTNVGEKVFGFVSNYALLNVNRGECQKYETQ